MVELDDCIQVDQSQVRTSACFIQSLLPKSYVPTVGIIGGSGLSTLENIITSFDSNHGRLTISFDKILGFPVPSVPGHAGKLIFGTIVTEQKRINAVVMSGRAHFYEGNDPRVATFPIRVLGSIGVDVIIVTNAAGGLNKTYKTGDIMIMNDHISFPSLSGSYNPLLGPQQESKTSGPILPSERFLALSDAYDYDLRKAAWKAWELMSFQSEQTDDEKIGDKLEVEGGRKLHEGVYAFVAGPTYETRAEARLLRNLGADVVGMSTVPEVIVARQIGISLLGLSLVTNMVVQDRAPRGDDVFDESAPVPTNISDGKASHAEVLDSGRIASEVIRDLIINIVNLHLT